MSLLLRGGNKLLGGTPPGGWSSCLASLSRLPAAPSALVRPLSSHALPAASSPAASSFDAPSSSSYSSSDAQAADCPAPGVRDAERFRLTPSTEFWRTWDPRQDVPSARALVAHALTELTGAGEGGRTSQRYFASHLLRTSAFASLGAAGFLTHAATSAMRMTTPAGPTIAQPTPAALADAGYRALLEALAAYRQDGRRVAAGDYAFPWDMESSRHPQYRGVLRKAARFMFEATQTLRRRRAAEPDNLWVRGSVYPEYYKNTYHYQTDGWLSTHSSEVYETSTESLFVGRQDAMQRLVLPPLMDHLANVAGRGASDVQQDQHSPPRVLELACGTGRLGTFVRDNLPYAEYHAVDLSPFYLERARSNHRAWEKLRGAKLARGAAGAHFYHDSIERVPDELARVLGDDGGWFDAVYCVYTFHELPMEAREAAVRTMFQALKPGGVAVLVDSIQLGDREPLDRSIGRFGDFNEPHYRGYISTDLGALFERAGFACVEKEINSSSKRLSFMKPTT